MTDANWHDGFDRLAHPTMRFVKAALPHMIERGKGKVIVVTSAAPLLPVADSSAYATARAAQNTYVQVIGAEAAPHNVRLPVDG